MRIDPDGEELRVKITLPGGVEIEHAALQWIGEVPAFVDEALRSVGVRVDNDSVGMNLSGIDHWLHLYRRVARTGQKSAEEKACGRLLKRHVVSSKAVLFSHQ